MSYPIVFDPEATVFTTQGIGVLSDATYCRSKEVLNGLYEIELRYPVSGEWFPYIQNRSIIACRPNAEDGRQAFRVYDISEPINSVVTIKARHLSYDLSGIPIEPFTETGVQAAIAGLSIHALAQHNFTITTDIINATTQFKVDVPSSIRSWFGGKEGSLIDQYGGEWKYNNYSCMLMRRRGQNRGVTIRYGKNLVDYESIKNDEDQYTGVLMYYCLDENGTKRVVSGNVVSAGTFLYTKIACIDASEHFKNLPTVAQLDAYAESYIESNNVNQIKRRLTFEFVGDTSDYITLGDTVKVIYRGNTYTARVTQTVWDVLEERYTSVSIGSAKATLSDTIRGLSDTTASGGTLNTVASGINVEDSNGQTRIYGDDQQFYIDGYPQGVDNTLTRILEVVANDDSDARITLGSRRDSGLKGSWSATIGRNQTASGAFSAAVGGLDCEAAGDYSFAQGHGVIAVSEGEVALGKYNDPGFLFSIGNGTEDEERSNAFAVDESGNLYAGTVKVASPDPGQSYAWGAVNVLGGRHVYVDIYHTMTLASGWNTIATISTDYAPQSTRLFPAILSDGTACRVEISNAGVVRVNSSVTGSKTISCTAIYEKIAT